MSQTATCPNGHESTALDWCSTCGAKMDASPAPTQQTPEAAPIAATAAPAAAGPTCDNCGEPRHPDDVFCESCGYDYASGSLPRSDAPPPTASPSGENGHAVPEPAEALQATVSVDADFFTATIGDVDLELPDPPPAATIVPLTGSRILIGRHSASRAIFPDIDLEALTGDPAVSSRHAMLERDHEGNWSVTDLGSTNGTFLAIDADEPIDAGIALPVASGASLYIGAWTRIDLA